MCLVAKATGECRPIIIIPISTSSCTAELRYGNTLAHPWGPPDGPVVNIARYEGCLLHIGIHQANRPTLFWYSGVLDPTEVTKANYVVI